MFAVKLFVGKKLHTTDRATYRRTENWFSEYNTLSTVASLWVTNRCKMRSFWPRKISSLNVCWGSRIKLQLFFLRMKLLKNCSFDDISPETNNLSKCPIYRCPYSYDCHCMQYSECEWAISIPKIHCMRNQHVHLSTMYTLHPGWKWKRKRFNNNEKVQTKLNLLLHNSQNSKEAERESKRDGEWMCGCKNQHKSR